VGVGARGEDADFNDPLPDPQAAAAAAAGSNGGGSISGPGGGGSKYDPEAVGKLSAMGFTNAQASAALQVSALHLAFIQLLTLPGSGCSQTSPGMLTCVDCSLHLEQTLGRAVDATCIQPFACKAMTPALAVILANSTGTTSLNQSHLTAGVQQVAGARSRLAVQPCGRSGRRCGGGTVGGGRQRPCSRCRLLDDEPPIDLRTRMACQFSDRACRWPPASHRRERQAHCHAVKGNCGALHCCSCRSSGWLGAQNPGRPRAGQPAGVRQPHGASTAAGHYVAHIRMDGRWVIYNDEKVR
jgi:hypothetical protein